MDTPLAEVPGSSSSVLTRSSRGPALLVASTGGHLTQLQRLADHLLPLDAGRHWVTFDTPQSRSALRGQDVTYLPYIGPRDFLGVARGLRAAPAILKRLKPTRILSTGSGIALPFFTAGRALGIPCQYIESAARSLGPSVTGRAVSRLPGVECFTQYHSWANQRWRPTVSVFDLYVAEPQAEPLPEIRRLVVTLGTIQGYAFDRLLYQLLDIVPASVQVFWQLAPMDVGRLHIAGAHGQVRQADLLSEIEQADAVIAHAGIGSAISILDAGLRPILVPRRKASGEHVDDHQLQIAAELAERRLATTCDASQLTWNHVVESQRFRVLGV